MHLKKRIEEIVYNSGGEGGGVHVLTGGEGEVMDGEKNVKPRHYYCMCRATCRCS